MRGVALVWERCVEHAERERQVVWPQHRRDGNEHLARVVAHALRARLEQVGHRGKHARQVLALGACRQQRQQLDDGDGNRRAHLRAGRRAVEGGGKRGTGQCGCGG
eukprot:354490-Chlamydomonas_euryale.AAC.5